MKNILFLLTDSRCSVLKNIMLDVSSDSEESACAQERGVLYLMTNSYR